MSLSVCQPSEVLCEVAEVLRVATDATEEVPLKIQMVLVGVSWLG